MELLQQLIRNECVNDGTPDSGNERANADVLLSYLEGDGLDAQRFTSQGDRTSIVARIEGTDPSAPKLCLMGHTDVVSVIPAGWTRDPFGGELIDGEVCRRGALDMFCLTASMAVAFKALARTGWCLKVDLIYLGVADEEAGGGPWRRSGGSNTIGTRLRCDYLLTEMGGYVAGDGRSISIQTAQKGMPWRRLTVVGTSWHAAPARSVPASMFARSGQRFHGNDERIDVESLRLQTHLWPYVANDLFDLTASACRVRGDGCGLRTKPEIRVGNCFEPHC